MKIRIIVFAALSFLTLASCGKKAADTSTSKYTEEVEENVLYNDFFKMTVHKPNDWVALDHSASTEMIKLGGDLASSGNKDLEAVLDATEKRNIPLFSIFRYAPGSPVDVNPNVMGLAEDISIAPGIKTGKDYFFHAKKLMAQSNASYTFSDEYSEREIGGALFDQMDVTISLSGTSSNQSYYAAKYKNYMVIIIESYGVDQDNSVTKTVLDGIAFDWQ